MTDSTNIRHSPALPGRVRRLVGRLLPPKQLGRRIQWLFLLMGLFNIVGAVPRIMMTMGLPDPVARR